jgi:hypothetical protein
MARQCSWIRPAWGAQIPQNAPVANSQNRKSRAAPGSAAEYSKSRHHFVMLIFWAFM